MAFKPIYTEVPNEDYFTTLGPNFSSKTKRVISGYESTETGAKYTLTTPVAQPPFQGLEAAVFNGQMQGFKREDDKLKTKQEINRYEQEKKDLQAEIEREKAALEAQRKGWAEQEQKTRAEFTKQQQLEAKKLEDQKVKFESDRVAREQGRKEAAERKQVELGNQRRLSGATLLGDILRKAGVVEDGTVAEEDKGQLSEDDKAKMFGTGQDQKKKAKQTFLDRILGRDGAATPAKQ